MIDYRPRKPWWCQKRANRARSTVAGTGNGKPDNNTQGKTSVEKSPALVRLAILVSAALVVSGCGGDSSRPAVAAAPAPNEAPELAVNSICLGELLIGGTGGIEISNGASLSVSMSGINLGGWIQISGLASARPRDGIDISLDPEPAPAPSCPSAEDVDYLYFSADGLPEHDTGTFPNDQSPHAISEQDRTFRVTAHPVIAASSTALSAERFDGVLVNGVPVQMRESFCVPGSDCNTWQVNPLHEPSWFGIDSHNAHTLADGSYHYHGNPNALYDDIAPAGATIIGTAADGFPIFGPWIDDGGVARKVTSSYALKIGERPVNAFLTPALVGPWTGEYVEDYEYVADSGDLDECNGMFIEGTYGYFVTDDFPYLMNCLKGTPDPSFELAP